MRKVRAKRARGEGGFTLIELLVAIIILGILGAIVVFAVGGVTDKGEDSALKQDHKTLRTAEEAYYAQNKCYADEPTLVAEGFLASESTLHDVVVSDPTCAPDFQIVCQAGSECAAPPAPVEGGTLIVASGAASTIVLNPAVTSEGSIHSASEDMFNGLVDWDAANAALIVPSLADTWQIDNTSGVFSGGPNTNFGATNPRCSAPPCTTAVFELNDNVKWHDGADVKPADVEFTFENAVLPFHSRTGALLNAGLGVTGGGKPCGQPGAAAPPACFAIPANAIEVVGDAVQFNFSLRQLVLLKTLNVTEAPIIPQHVFQACAAAGTLGTLSPKNACPPNTAPIGSGPFKFETAPSATQFRTVKNPLYKDFRPGLPHLDAVVKQAGTTITALENGDVDVASIGGADINRLETHPAIAQNVVPRGAGGGNCIQTWAYNTTESRLRDTSTGIGTLPTAPYHSPADPDEPAGTDSSHLAGQSSPVGVNAPPHRILGDERVREALFRTFDRQAVVNDVLFGAGRVADSPFHRFIPGYVPQSLPTVSRAAADSLLDSAGWGGPRDGNGFRTALNHPNENHAIPDLRVPDGTPLRLSAIYATPTSSPPTLDFVAAKLKADAKLIGVDIRTDSQSNAAHLAPKVFLARDFDLASISYCNGEDPFQGVRRQWHSAEVRAATFTNASGYKNATMDSFWNAAALEPDDASRADEYAAIQAQGVNGIVGDPTAPKLPMLWIYESFSIRGTRTNCAGFNHNNTGLFFEAAYCQK